MAMSNVNAVMFGYTTRSSDEEWAEDGNESQLFLTGSKVREVLGLLSIEGGALYQGSFNLQQFKDGILTMLDRLIEQTETIKECLRNLDESEDQDLLFTSKKEAVRVMEEQMDFKWQRFNEVVEELFKLIDYQANELAERIPTATNEVRSELQSHFIKRLPQGVIEKEGN